MNTDDSFSVFISVRVIGHLVFGTRMRPFWAALLLTAALLVALPAFAQREIFSPAADVSLTVSTERKQYRAGEDIVVEYRISNASNHRIFVPLDWSATCPSQPHIWAWFENRAGKHFIPGWAGDCSADSAAKTVTERMAKEAVLLRPRGLRDGTIRLKTDLFGGLKPGRYRIEASLDGWREQDFGQEQQSELAGMAAPFLRGEVSASAVVTLTP